MSHEHCHLCDLPVAVDGVLDDAGHAFCCAGCRSVYHSLGSINDLTDDDLVRSPDTTDTVPDDHDRSFLSVEGMHCATCERFIESVALNLDGVSQATASYVTETVRIDHDPTKVTIADLIDRLTGHGYSAFARDNTFQHRQANHWMYARLAVGVLVGMMVMIQYITVIYPSYFPGLLYDMRMSQYLAASMGTGSGRYFFLVVGALTTIVLFFTGKPILTGAYVSVKARTPNMDLLVAIAALSAYAYSVLTIVVGGQHVYFDVTVAIIVVVTVGNFHERTVKRRATNRLSDLTSIRVDEATRVDSGALHTVPVADLEPGDHVLVRAGERIPIDGRVIDGNAITDEALVTGESLPIEKQLGDDVIGGTIVTDGTLTVETGATGTSSLDRITDLAWELQSSRKGIQKLADKLATIFVPGVLVLGVLVTFVYLGMGASISRALLVGLTVLIVSCPCALGLATPLAVASGIEAALSRNIVIFDDSVFERLRDADTIVFDKTGTLTTGNLRVQSTTVPESLLRDVGVLESHSVHPVANAIARSFGPVTDGGAVESRSEPVASASSERVTAVETFQNGIAGTIDNHRLLIGHPSLFAAEGWRVPSDVSSDVAAAEEQGTLPVIVGRDGTAVGVIELGDELREHWESVISELATKGLRVIVLSGDDTQRLGVFEEYEAVSEVFGGVPPEGKAETVARLAAEGTTVMVGDGSNDAPALARADLGIALGSGTAMAVDAADIAIIDDDISSLSTILGLADATGRRIKENLGWAFCYNVIAIPVAILGLLNPLFAAVAMALSSILVVSNSSRSLLSD